MGDSYETHVVSLGDSRPLNDPTARRTGVRLEQSVVGRSKGAHPLRLFIVVSEREVLLKIPMQRPWVTSVRVALATAGSVAG